MNTIKQIKKQYAGVPAFTPLSAYDFRALNRVTATNEYAQYEKKVKDRREQLASYKINCLARKVYLNNYICAFLEENAPEIARIWNTYTGKPNGEKTRARLITALSAVPEINHIYIDDGYCTSLKITLGLGNTPIEMCYNNGNPNDPIARKMIINYNKYRHINARYLFVWNVGAYIDNVNVYIRDKDRQEKGIQKQIEQLEDSTKYYNATIANCIGVECINLPAMRIPE